MVDIRQKVSFLKGLIEGLDIKKDSKEGRVFEVITEILVDMAEDIHELQVAQGEMEEYLDDIDEDLYKLEDEVYEGHNCDDYEDDENEDFDPDEDYVEVVCPDCGDTVCFEADILDDEDLIEVTCPNCDAVVFINDEEYTEQGAKKEDKEDNNEDL
ncbi:MAG: CD1247 N-terminal domain-containing protein [Bacillota bacterium]